MNGRVPPLAVLAAALTALAVGYLPQGPPGVVVERTNAWSPATKSRAYSLTVRTANGERKTFQVPVSDYDRCTRGAPYPNCAKD
ncbi:hypothetical protein ACIRP3_29250 [Streptomyces sp. NPDC101209]|uniref:hypothetical protein n=1 Tax=Streptomyces sp. NPDC101209 TaxID=3366129 RepID=UPI00381F2DEB